MVTQAGIEPLKHGFSVDPDISPEYRTQNDIFQKQIQGFHLSRYELLK